MSVTAHERQPRVLPSVYHALIAVIVASLTCAAYKIQVFGEAEALYKAIRLVGFCAIATIAMQSIATSLGNVYAVIGVLFVTLCIMFASGSDLLACTIPFAISVAAASLVDRTMAAQAVKTTALALSATNLLLILVALFEQGPISLMLSIGEVGMPNQNYISAVIFSTILLNLAQPTRASNYIVVLSFGALIVLQSRTGVLAGALVLFYVSKPMQRTLMVLMIALLAPWLVDMFLQKYQSDDLAGAASGRTGPWSFYMTELIRSPQYLLPEVMRINTGERFFSPETGLHHGPHNLFIQIVVSHGWVIGLPVIIFMIATLAVRRGAAKTCLIGCLIYGFFEPTIWFVDSLPGFIFISSLTLTMKDFTEQMGEKWMLQRRMES